MERAYIAIDLKSFYASVECVERHLDPLTTHLVVADESRTEKTICLAVSPSLKKYGIPGRARLFEVNQKVKEINGLRQREVLRLKRAGKNSLSNETREEPFSADATALAKDPFLMLRPLIAPPRMALYMEYSSRVFNIYQKYVSAEDIHVYSVDECFIDVTNYLATYKMTAEQLARKMILDVLKQTGITATAGIGTNLYLCKVAMDIVAKHIPPDGNGVRIAKLNEKTYREQLWAHQPLTDFWRIGKGYADKLAQHGMYTMGDVARCSIGTGSQTNNEELLYKLFGINAELLIDHAWGYEPCTMKEIKNYRPEAHSLSRGQVLSEPYSYERCRVIIKEMADQLALELVEQCVVTDQIGLSIGYDTDNITDPKTRFTGEVTSDRYGRKMPKPAHGSIDLGEYTSSAKIMIERAVELYERITNPSLHIRRIYIGANRVNPESETVKEIGKQTDFFSDPVFDEEQERIKAKALEEEKNLQKAMLEIKKKFGKNAILKGISYEEGATARERNGMMGGHKA